MHEQLGYHILIHGVLNLLIIIYCIVFSCSSRIFIIITSVEESSRGYTIYVKVWETCKLLTSHFQSLVAYVKNWLDFWLPAELKLSYLKKPYQITMQTFQMAILLLFEKTDSLTCKEVQESLQLNSEQFGKHLMSLIESKILLANMEVINMTVLSLYSSRSQEFVS